MSRARDIVEAETPKGFLRQAPPPTIERPMFFGSVPVGAWFRCGRFVLKRLDPNRSWDGTGDQVEFAQRHADEEAEVMDAPSKQTIGEIWTFDHRSYVWPTTTDPKTASQSCVSPDEVAEAEDPKGVFRTATAAATDYVDRVLAKNGWRRRGSCPHCWDYEWQDYASDYQEPTPKAYGNAVRTVWWDNDAQEWVLKHERRTRRGFKDMGHQVFKSGRELLQAISRFHHLIEAEDPKSFVKHHAQDIEIQQILAKLELDDVPWPDSFKPGQRVRRTRHNPFGARPFGGNPNDIGDLGTIIAFHGRKDEPEHALYTVRWDRHPISSEYCNHTNVEPVVEEAEDPKRFIQAMSARGPASKKALVRRVEHYLRELPEFSRQNLEEYYAVLDRRVMPKVMSALCQFYGVQEPNGARGLFRTWVKTDATERAGDANLVLRRAAHIVNAFEGFAKEE